MLRPVSFAAARQAQSQAPRSVSSIPTSVTANGSSATATSSINVDYMPGPAGPNPTAYGAVNLSGAGQAEGPTRFKVENISVYEKGTDKLVASVDNPTPYSSKTEAPWGVRKETYGFGFPSSKIDPNKEDTFVVTTRINGSEPKEVRTPYAKPNATY